jgi:hypothetical protein
MGSSAHEGWHQAQNEHARADLAENSGNFSNPLTAALDRSAPQRKQKFVSISKSTVKKPLFLDSDEENE